MKKQITSALTTSAEYSMVNSIVAAFTSRWCAVKFLTL